MTHSKQPKRQSSWRGAFLKRIGEVRVGSPERCDA